MKKLFLIILFFALSGLASAQGSGTKKKKVLPPDYGKVVLNNYSLQSGMPPVVFNHWSHRRIYTCRLCHVDIGFAMETGGTKIRAADNIKGYYCGACHNGRNRHDGRNIFEACDREYQQKQYERCVRCHSLENGAKAEQIFQQFAATMPRETFGNGINWEKAEEEGKLKLVDHLEGVSVPKEKLKVQEDFSLKPKLEGMPDIIFSHAKHTFWSGCELCHPDIFVGIRKGSTKYSMIDIFDGKYCGVCHGRVAFPLTDCQRCHVKREGR